MTKNIFEKIETEKRVPEDTKEEIIIKIKSVEKGKDSSGLFNTKLYGALVNFFKLKKN